MKRLLYFLSFLPFLASCNLNTVIDEMRGKNDDKAAMVLHTVNHLYSLQVPAFMDSMPELNDVASFQYGNALKELYCIVIDEDKESVLEALEISSLDLEKNDTTLLEHYATATIDKYVLSLAEARKERIRYVHKDNYRYILHDLSGKINHNGAYMKYVTIESKDHVFQLLVWTLDKYKDKYSPLMDKVIESFKVMERTEDALPGT